MESEINIDTYQNSLDENMSVTKDSSYEKDNSADDSWVTAFDSNIDETFDSPDKKNVVNRRSGLFSITHILKSKNRFSTKSAWDTKAETTAGSNEALDSPLTSSKVMRRKRADRTSGSNGLLNSTVADYALHNNNNNVKNERLSPNTPDTSSRSRSATPSGTAHPEVSSADNPLLAPITGRNYSDFMRSLAAKYNHANPNDYFNAARNGFPPPLDPRFKASPAPMAFPSTLLPGLTATPTTKEPDLSTKKADFASVLGPFAGAAGSMFPPLIDMSTTQTLLAMVKSAKEAELQGLLKNVKRQETSSPLDLSSGAVPTKRARIKTPCSGSPCNTSRGTPPSLPKRPESESPKLHEDISGWSVDDVANFITGIDICAEYAQNFRDQRIDGSGLPLLTEEHLTQTIGMKLGPALKLRSILSKKLGSCNVCLHCSHCHNSASGGSPEVSTNNGGNTSDSGGAS